ncbi:MAG: hypothetical protein QM785_16700 [Pyrinomonadaceae bacterium]
MATNYAACPKCGSNDSELAKFTWWGGVLGPKVLTHVKCPDCKHKYNGKTGKDNTAGIVIYTAVVGIAAFVLLFAAFFMLARL